MAQRIGNILTTIIPKEHAWKIKLLGKWPDIIGQMIEKVRIEKINNSSIVLGVCHPTWAHELSAMSHVLKKKINTALQEDKIKALHFRTVSFSEKNNKKTNNFKPQAQNPHKQEHCLNIMQHSHLQTIANEELRTVLQKFYFRCQNKKKESSS